MHAKNMKTAIVSIVGPSGVGKTTLLEKLIPELNSRGLKVGTVKHDVHGFEMDHSGKDSYRHKKAGASVSIISSPSQIGMVMDVDHDHRPEELAGYLSGLDLMMTEGYKKGDSAKIEVYRPEIHAEILCRDDGNLVAIVSQTDLDLDIPRYAPADTKGLADFLIDYFELSEQ